MIRSINRNLDPTYMKESYSRSIPVMPLENTEIEKIDSIQNNDDSYLYSTEVLGVWINAIVDHISSNKDSLIADFALDLIQNIQDYLDKTYSINELEDLSAVLNSEVFVKAIGDNELFNIISISKDNFNKSIVSAMQSDECISHVQKKIKDSI